jgi:hypothetical protein
VGAFVLAALTPAGLLVLGPFLGPRTALWCLLSAAATVVLARSAVAPHTRRGRSFGGDALWVFAAVTFAWWLAQPGLLGGALALWGFGLMLSLGALVPPRDGARPSDGSDAFDAAHARALALLEDEP